MVKCNVTVLVSYDLKQLFGKVVETTVVIKTAFGWNNLSSASSKKSLSIYWHQFDLMLLPEKVSKLIQEVLTAPA